MKLKAFAGLILFCRISVPEGWAQVRAGTPEAKMFEQITAETSPDSKIELITAFEKQFPQSKILPSVYLMAVEIYRDKQDRPRILEFGEKTLRLDNTNITAMMLLARNYAIDAKDLDRAMDLAQRALDRMETLRTQPAPGGYSTTQWNDYLKANEESATQILTYVKAMKARADRVKSSTTSSVAGESAQTPSRD
jgi:hypothetical protein